MKQFHIIMKEKYGGWGWERDERKLPVTVSDDGDTVVFFRA